MEHKEEINIQSEQNEEKRIQKKVGEFKKSLGHLQTHQHPNHRGGRRRRGRARNWKLIWNNNERKLPQFGEENRHTSPGSSENSKQVGLKEDHTETHHN